MKRLAHIGAWLAVCVLFCASCQTTPPLQSTYKVIGVTDGDTIKVLKGKEQKPLSFDYYGQGIALGPKDAVGFAGYPNDHPVGPVIRGGPAVFIRNFFVSLLGQMLELERRRPGLFLWTGKGRYEKAKRAAARRRPSEATM